MASASRFGGLGRVQIKTLARMRDNENRPDGFFRPGYCYGVTPWDINRARMLTILATLQDRGLVERRERHGFENAAYYLTPKGRYFIGQRA